MRDFLDLAADLSEAIIYIRNGRTENLNGGIGEDVAGWSADVDLFLGLAGLTGRRSGEITRLGNCLYNMVDDLF